VNEGYREKYNQKQEEYMEELREIRKVRGLSQRALAAEADVDKLTIIRAEQGKTHPHAETLEKLAKTLQVSVADLLQPPYEKMDLEQLAVEGEKLRQYMIEATEKGDMSRLDLLLSRGERISKQIRKLDPPYATVKFRRDAPPEVHFYRTPTEDEQRDLEEMLEKFEEYTVRDDLLLIG